MQKTVHHVVKRPGRKHEDADVEIPIAEELVVTPGSELLESDLSFYSRVDPIETQNIDKAADRDWV